MKELRNKLKTLNIKVEKILTEGGNESKNKGDWYHPSRLFMIEMDLKKRNLIYMR